MLAKALPVLPSAPETVLTYRLAYPSVLPAPRRLLAALLLGSAGAALADPLTVSTNITTPVATATAANNSPGDITIVAGASVAVTGTSVATINSDNLLTNNGTLSSSAASNATGVLIDGTGGRGNARLVNNGSISIAATGGSGNTGILVSGGPVTGSIGSTNASTITVGGNNARGVAITSAFAGNIDVRGITVAGTGSSVLTLTAPVTGNVSLGGTSGNSGAGGYGILVSAPISGQLRNAGTLSVGTNSTVDNRNTTIAGQIGLAGIRVGNSVGGGIVNDRYFIDSTGAVVPPASVNTATNTLVIATVSATGTAPALSVGADPATAQPISIGVVGSDADAFGIINRGVLVTTSGNSGLATNTVQIGGGGAATSVAGGLVNQANARISANSLNARATAISVGAGANLPAVVNLGGIDATAQQTAASGSTAAGAGGAALGIAVAAGATLPSVTNSGTITVTAAGSGNNAIAIQDSSGTLTSIVNSGTITTNSPGGAARAIDLSASNAAVAITNSGSITGDIVLGSGAAQVQLTGGSVAGAIAFGSGGGTLALSGTTTFGGTLTSATPIALSLSDSARLGLLNGPATVASVTASGSSLLVVPTRGSLSGLTVTGAASFTGSSVIRLSLQSLAQQQQVTIISAAGGITTDHASTLVDRSITPYLFTVGTPQLTDTTLSVALNRRSAAEIGLSPGQTALFTASLSALAANSPESAAIANLPNQASVIAAYRQITPSGFGRANLHAAETFADLGFGAAFERLSALNGTRKRGDGGLGVWAQEFGDFIEQKAGVEETRTRNGTLGIAGGIDKPLLGLDALGLALLSSWTNVKKAVAPGVADTAQTITTQGIAPYLAWSRKALFVQASAVAARVTYSSSRALNIGSVSDTVLSNWSGYQVGAGLTVGGRFRFGRFQLVPTNSISWTMLHQNGYSEQGGGAFSLAVASRTDSITTDTGRLSLTYLKPFLDGNLLAEIHGSYSQRITNANAPTIAHFLTTGDAITLPHDPESNSKYGYGGALGYLQQGLKLVLGYDRRENSSYKDQQVAFTASAAF